MVKKVKNGQLRWGAAEEKSKEQEKKVQDAFIKKSKSYGFSFETADMAYYCDVIDDKLDVYGEVKPDDCSEGLAQILMGMAKAIRDNKIIPKGYILLIDKKWACFSEFPDKTKIMEFYNKYNQADLSPSKFTGQLKEEAMSIIGDFYIKVWSKEVIPKNKLNEIGFSLNEFNIEVFNQLCIKYKIDGPMFIDMIVRVNDGNKIIMDKNKLILMYDGVEVFDITYDGNPTPIEKFILTHARLESMVQFKKIFDQMGVTGSKAVEVASYYTGLQFARLMSKIAYDTCKPTMILEPYAGGGSLGDYFIGKVNKIILNDFDKKAKNALNLFYGKVADIYENDFVTWKDEDILRKLPKNENLLIITNPPFNSIRNIVRNVRKVSKKGKLTKVTKVKFSYGTLGDKYGRGNQILPTIGKAIDIIESRGEGYLAFFSPLGLFCERKRYNKLLDALLKNFEYRYGEIGSGESFYGVSKNIPIVFTIWKYKRNCNTKLENIEFSGNKLIGFKRDLLLKDVWKYNVAKIQKGEIAVQCNDRFNTPNPKTFYMDVKKGGSELLEENVKKHLDLPIATELVCGLWSSIVGSGAIIKHPLTHHDAYVHLPDFLKNESLEILAYALIYDIIYRDYTSGMIGFDKKKNFYFGKSQRLNDGANYLIKTYSNLSVGNETLKDIFEKIRDGLKPDCRDLIKKEISERLNKIGYWDYIPLPKKKKTNPLGP